MVLVLAALLGLAAFFTFQGEESSADSSRQVASKREGPGLGKEAGSLKLRRDGNVDKNEAAVGGRILPESAAEEKSILIGAIDPMERGATRDAAGNFVAKTRGTYKPGKKIPRHSLATYVPVKYAEDNQPQFLGDPVVGFVNLPGRAKAGVDKGRFELKPNGNGEFPRIYVKPEEEVEVRLIYPKAKKGDKYAVAAQDGGLLDDGFPTAMVETGKNKEVAFRFAPSANAGTHRIVVRSTAGEATILDLWVGDEVVFAKSNKK